MSLKVENLSFSYKEKSVLSEISFKLESGTFTALLGANGAGKSTLFKCMLGLLSSHQGNVFFNAFSLRDLTPQLLAKQVAYIPQSQETAFNFSVFDMVLMGTTAELKGFRIPSTSQKEETLKALERLNILHLKNRGYREISGGERQLVLIARALAQKAKILILDEPIAHLDFGNQLRMLQHIQSLAKQGYTILQSMHDPHHVLTYADNVLALHKTKLIETGEPKKVVTKELIKTMYDVDVKEFR